MAKSTSKLDELNESTENRARLRKALDSLGLVDSTLDEDEWIEQVRKQVGDDPVDEWLERDNNGDFDAEYDFTYSSFAKAKHFSAGWRASASRRILRFWKTTARSRSRRRRGT